jgi:hypothetical protein
MVRFLIAGIVLLGVSTVSVVQHWTTATSTGFVGDYTLQLVGAVIGAALVVTGIVKYVRR